MPTSQEAVRKYVLGEPAADDASPSGGAVDDIEIEELTIEDNEPTAEATLGELEPDELVLQENAAEDDSGEVKQRLAWSEALL